jgi:MarR family transcriptional regulator for hemolysin
VASEAETKKKGTISDPFNMSGESPRRQVGLRMTIIARLQRNAFDRKVAGLNVTRSQDRKSTV